MQNKQIETIIHSGKESNILLDQSNVDQLMCLKVLKTQLPSQKQLKEFENEFHFSSSTECSSIRKALKKTTDSSNQTIVFEYIKGSSLLDYTSTNSLQEKIDLAIQITKAISEIHKEGITHRNLNPGNILIEHDSRKIFIIDFSLATKIASKQENGVINSSISLSYISPEQSGRINRSVDNRSDIYSLGIILYQLFTDKVPFESSDPLELIYAHIAKSPALLNEVKTEIPEIISNIVLKTISKNVEDRYQSASGLLYDLERCKKALKSDNTVALFTVAENDYSGKLSLQEHLYHREKEIQIIETVFHKSCSGNSQFILISGASGTGKSALCRELQKTITRVNGNYLLGKFEQFQRDIPYAAFTQAFSGFLLNILKQEETIQAIWKSKILQSIGRSGKILTDFIPGLEVLIGVQPDIQDLNGLEVQNRFDFVISNFINTISTVEHPLIIYIDDLQWADKSSLNMLKMIVTEIKNAHLLIIGSYRSNEIEKDTTLRQLIEEQREINNAFSEIELTNLEKENVCQLVKNVLHSDQKNTDELAETIFNKTEGNPFYVHQFIKTINEDGILFFNFEKKEWVWDNEHVCQMNVSGNVVDLLKLNINKLPEESIELLKIAASIGTKFDLETISNYLKKEFKLVEVLIQKPLLEGMIIQTSNGYKFSHDRMQEAIYQLISEEDKKEIHLNIGKSLSENITEHDLQDQIFDIVKHWNIARSLISDQKAIKHLVNLNQIAGHKSRTSAAYIQALNYFENCISLLEKNHWKSNYQNTLDIFNEAAEVAYISANYEKANELITLTIENAESLDDSIKSYETKILMLIAQNELMQAIELGLVVLKKLGHKFPAKTNQLNIIAGLLKTKMILRGKSEEYYNSLPEMTDTRDLAAVRIMYKILSAAYFGMANLVPLLLFKMVQMSVQRGLSRISPFSFIGYGYIECVFMNKVDLGISYGNISLNMLNRFKIDELKASTLMTYNVFLLHWKKPFYETIKALEDGFEIGLENGDYEYSSFLAHNITYHSFLSGIPLQEIAEKSEKLDKQIVKFRQDLTLKRLRLYRESINNLIQTKKEPDVLNGTIFNEEENTLPDILQNQGYFQNLYLQKMILAIVFNKTENAIEFAGKARKYLESVKGSALYSTFFFYESLALISACKTHPENKKTILKSLDKNLKELKKFEKLSPENFAHKTQLIGAEILHIKGKSEKARNLYDRAIKNAVNSRMLQDEAICWERASFYYFDIKEIFIARFYIQHALTTYQSWGAEAKVEQMKIVYTDHLEDKTTKEQSNDIDLLSIIKASTAISGEIILSRLLKNLMTILLKNAGAQKGFLLLERNGELFIEAESSDESEVVEIQSIPLLNSGKLAETVVNHVVKTLESVIIEDATENLKFSHDEYIQKNKSKSILCFPFINQGKLRGLIYLSNDLTNGAFTENRLALLKMLTGQIAVSIENASLYENLENQQEILKVEISEKNRMNLELEKSIKEKETLLAEVHHRVKNNLAVVSGLLELENLYVKEKKVSDVLKNSKNRIKSIALLHEKLYQDKNVEKIDYQTYISELIQHIKLSYNEESKNVSIHTNIDPLFISMEIAQPLSLLINELITNSYKHAFNNIENASITINLRHTNNEIIFEYKDNGIGFDVDEKVKNDSIGMNLIQTFISQLDGELVNNTKTGTGCEMIVSIKEF